MTRNRQGSKLRKRCRIDGTTPIILALCLASAGCANIRSVNRTPTAPDVMTIVRELMPAIPPGARVAVRPLATAMGAFPSRRAEAIDHRLADTLARAAEGRYEVVAREDAVALWDEAITRPGEPEPETLRRFAADVLVVGHVERSGSVATLSYRAVNLSTHAVLAITTEQPLTVPRVDIDSEVPLLATVPHTAVENDPVPPPVGQWLPIGSGVAPPAIVALPLTAQPASVITPKPPAPVPTPPATFRAPNTLAKPLPLRSTSHPSSMPSGDVGTMNMIIATGIGMFLLRAFRRQTAHA